MPVLLATFKEEVPQEELDGIREDFRLCGVECNLSRMGDLGPWNCLDWLIPTAIVLYLGRPYIESFLGEMGKDHYAALKHGTGKLWQRLFGSKTSIPEVHKVTAGGIQKTEFTLKFSVVATSLDGREIKLLLPDQVSEEEFVLQTDAFLDFLVRYYRREESARIPEAKSDSSIDKHVLVTLSEDKESLRFLDPLPPHVRNWEKHNKANSLAPPSSGQ